MRLIYAASLVVVVGCATDEAIDSTGEAEQAVSGLGVFGLQCSNAGGCDIQIDTTANKACFLAGVAGNFTGGFGAQAAVWDDGAGHYHLFAAPSTNNNKIGVEALCVTPASNKVTAHWDTGQNAALITGGSARRRCFLTDLFAVGGAMSTYGDLIGTFAGANNNWLLVGGSSTGDLAAGAVCFDVATDLADRTVPFDQSGSTTPALTPNVTGAACGLTTFGGQFTSNSFTDGVVINFPAPTSRNWTWTLSDFKQGSATCFK